MLLQKSFRYKLYLVEIFTVEIHHNQIWGKIHSSQSKMAYSRYRQLSIFPYKYNWLVPEFFTFFRPGSQRCLVLRPCKQFRSLICTDIWVPSFIRKNYYNNTIENVVRFWGLIKKCLTVGIYCMFPVVYGRSGRGVQYNVQ